MPVGAPIPAGIEPALPFRRSGRVWVGKQRWSGPAMAPSWPARLGPVRRSRIRRRFRPLRALDWPRYCGHPIPVKKETHTGSLPHGAADAGAGDPHRAARVPLQLPRLGDGCTEAPREAYVLAQPHVDGDHVETTDRTATCSSDPESSFRILIPYYPHPSRAPEEVGLWIFGGWREAGRQGGEALGTRCTGSQWYRSQPGPPGSPLMVPGECRRPVPRAAGLSNARWIGLAAAAAVRRCSTAGSDAATAASWPPPSAACAAAPPARSGD